LLVCASALAEDFYRPLIRPRAPQTELVWFGRAMVLLVSGIAMALASDPESRVLGLVGYAWAGFGSAFGPVILLSLTWPRMTQRGALAGMVTGATTAIVWHNGSWFGYPSGPIAGLYEIVPGCLLATIAIIAASTLDDTPPESVVSLFDEMRIRSRID
jgi:sodium/proline symporter